MSLGIKGIGNKSFCTRTRLREFINEKGLGLGRQVIPGSILKMLMHRTRRKKGGETRKILEDVNG
jgi:hypothetical protein